MHLHAARLADPVGAVGGLLLHGRVPPAVVVEDVLRRGEVQPRAARLFKRRTAVERWHAWLDLSEVQNALHRRDHLWRGRCGLAALAWHMRLWGGDIPPGWLQSLLNP